MLRKATWRSGYATVCKTVYPGSIPGVASTRNFNNLGRILEVACERDKMVLGTRWGPV